MRRAILSRMTWVIVGLGNPDEEHIRTRHNAGRMAVEYFAKENGLDEWKDDKKSRAFVARGAVERVLAVLVLPNTYMNKSGSAALHYIKSVKAAEKLIVVYDDLDLPIGSMKVSFDRGSGGHKGLDSIMRAVKTRRFTRIRIGVSPATASGVVKKPQGEKEVNKFILGEFKSSELPELKKIFKRASEAIVATMTDGPGLAMNHFNS